MTGEKTSFNIIPGLMLAACVAVPAIYLNNLYKPINAVAIAIAAGVLIRNIFGLPSVCQTGNIFVVKRILPVAIIILGAQISFFEVAKISGRALICIICCISTAITLTYWLARLLKLPPCLGTLIGVGTAICGNSAIIATAPVIGANDEEVSFAVATITLFGLIAVVVYPILGHFLAMPAGIFGQWAGTAINDTSQVVTAGYMYNEQAGNVATTVKLTRNLFMAPVIFLMSFLYRRRNTASEIGSTIQYHKLVPFFVFGFVGMAILRTLNVFTPEGINMFKNAAHYLIVLSVSAVGLGTSFAIMKKIGLKPFYIGLAASAFLACLSFILLHQIGHY